MLMLKCVLTVRVQLDVLFFLFSGFRYLFYTYLNVVLLSGLLPEHEGREERKPAQVDQSVEDTVLSEPLRHGVGLTRVAAAAVAAWE